jgi:response regulator RpfG family c-di-GMP phosphodiesterase
MENTLDKSQHTVLCVDDELNVLHSLKRLLRRESYQILTATSGAAALELLTQHKVHLVVSDQRMPDMSGTEFLSRVKDAYPNIMRIILTGYTEVDTITESINKGHIYKFFLKPWNDNTLKLEFRQALEQYDLIQANKRLDDTIVQQNRQLKEINECLEAMVEERTTEIALKNKALELSHAILEDLPLPIIGIDQEGICVLINKMVNHVFGQNRVSVGAHMDDCFPEAINQAVFKVFDKGNEVKINAFTVHSRLYNIHISPIHGRFKGRGVIVSLFEIKAG